MLVVRNLCATVGRSFKLADLSFSGGSGERMVVLGPNGSGKATLLRLIAGLESPRAGTISFADEVLSSAGRVSLPPEARSIGVLLQDVALFPHLRVRENVALALPPGMRKVEGHPLVDRALELGRVRHLQDRSVPGLSGGEQQRVALARALVRRPRMLLLDEPFHSLDGPAKREILSEVRSLVQQESVATLLVTHDLEEASAFADQVMVLRQGRMVQQGTLEELYQHPADELVAGLLGPVLSLEVEQARRSGIELPPDARGPRLFFRPEHLLLTPAPEDVPNGVSVASRRSSGMTTEVTIRLSDGLELAARSSGSSSLQPGQRVTARIDKTLSWPAAEEVAR